MSVAVKVLENEEREIEREREEKDGESMRLVAS